MTITQRSGIFVTGESRDAVSKALHTAGFATVTQAARAGVTVVAQGGAGPARTLAMQAIGMGHSVVSANPLLWALCGHQLASAAAAQKLWLGMEGALLGTTPLQPFLATAPASLTAVFSGAADAILQRLTHFGETFIAAEAQLRLLRQDMSDLHGKLSAARASVLGAMAYGNWHLPTTRTGLDGVTAADISWLNRQGLTLRYAVTVTPTGIHAAPMAFGAEGTFAQLSGSMVAETDSHGTPTTFMATQADESSRATAGLVADLTLWQHRAGWKMATPMPQGQITSMPQESTTQSWYVRAPALFRTELMDGRQNLQENFANNQWQALLIGPRPHNPEALILPAQSTTQSSAFRHTA